MRKCLVVILQRTTRNCFVYVSSHVKHAYFSWCNQSNSWFVTFSLSLMSKPSTLNCHAWWPASKDPRVRASIGIRRKLQRKHHFKIELCDWSSVLRSFYVCYVVKNGRGALLLASRFVKKAKNERFTAAGSYCRHVVVWQTTSKICTKKRAAREARLFFLIQPIKSLIGSVDVAVVIYMRNKKLARLEGLHA